MPRSRSRSIESSNCAFMSRLSTAPVSSSMRSASVDLPWSMCAMIAKLRMRRGAKGVGGRLDEQRGQAFGEEAQRAPAVADSGLGGGVELPEGPTGLREARFGEEEQRIVPEAARATRGPEDAAARLALDL